LLGSIRFQDARAKGAVIDVRMMSDAQGAHVWFDPLGLLLNPGQTVRWICADNYHTTAAYHPSNRNHSLRIPRSATPWSSQILAPGEHFAVTLTAKGTYDYFCTPHEAAGMVGRLIVGHPGGPGSMPFDWFKGTAKGRNWLDVPAAARAAFPAEAAIMQRHAVAGTAA
jgi:plastocyanin